MQVSPTSLSWSIWFVQSLSYSSMSAICVGQSSLRHSQSPIFVSVCSFVLCVRISLLLWFLPCDRLHNILMNKTFLWTSATTVGQYKCMFNVWRHTSAKDTDNQQPSSQFGHSIILEYSHKALSPSLLQWARERCSYGLELKPHTPLSRFDCVDDDPYQSWYISTTWHLSMRYM